MSDVDKELDKKEDEDLELEDQEQEDLQDDTGNQDEEQKDNEHVEADDEADDEDSDEEEEQQKPSRREELRIQQLLAKMKEEGTSPKKHQEDPSFNYDDELDADEDVKKKLKDDRESYGESRYKQGAEEVYRFSRFETRLEVDAPKVEAKHPQLDKESDEFNPVLADTVNRMYLSFVGFNPKSRSVRTDEIRYADYVESIWELASEIAGASVEQTTVNLKKQVAKTGIRPGGGAPKRLNFNKAPSEMTDEELDAIISSSLPSRK